MSYYYDVIVQDRITKEEVCIAAIVDQVEVRKILHFLGQYCADFEIITYPINFGKHERK